MKYRDINLSVNERVDDLIGRMSIEQKIDQITCVFASEGTDSLMLNMPNGIGNIGIVSESKNTKELADYCDEVQRYVIEHSEFGIPALFHVEAISGGMYAGATTFSSAIGQASTCDPELINQMANVIGKQLSAVGIRHALSPVMDIARDPRWGRLGETYGEDPTLAAAMGSAYVKGIQNAEENSMVIATGKHFVGHGACEGGLNMAQEILSERQLQEVHCKPFQAAINEAGLKSVMASYCMFNNEPVINSKALLTNLLRDEMKFDGIVVSDYIGLDRLVDPFCTAEDFVHAGMQGLTAGMDIEYPRSNCYSYKLKKYIEAGEFPIEVLDKAVKRVLKIKFEIGLFENPYSDQKKIKAAYDKNICYPLSRQVARETITLLKNEDRILPLKKETRKIAVIGPHSDSILSFFGAFSFPASLDMGMTREETAKKDYTGLEASVNHIEQRYPGEIREVSPRVEKKIGDVYPECKTLYQAIKEYLPGSEVTCALGCNASGTDLSGMKYALQVAEEADVIILTLGGKYGWGITSTSGEGIDSTYIGLPGKQEEFARQVFALHKKTVVIHFDGRPISSEYVVTYAKAILEAWQPGQFGGEVLAEVLFGDYNPGGRLTVTAARNVGQLPIYHTLPRGSGYVSAGHTGMIKNPNGYINDTAYPLFCFGHGLSYTSFKYGELKMCTQKVEPKEKVICRICVTNIGERDGDEVVQLYVTDAISSMVRPAIELAGFKRVWIEKGCNKTIEFMLDPSQLAFLDKEMKWKIEKGKFKLMAGASCFDIRSEASFEITKDEWISGSDRSFYAKARVLK